MSSKVSKQLPPFPADIPHAPIAIISSRKLLDLDEATCGAVLEACRTYGFFYLDLNDSDAGCQLLEDVYQIYDFSSRVFGLPFEEKNKYNVHHTGSSFGYKAAGTVKLTDKDRRPDSTEFFNIGKDHLFDIRPSSPYPDMIVEEKPLLRKFTESAHEAALVVLRSLARSLELPANTFTDLNRFEDPAGSHIRLTRKLEQPTASNSIGLPSHTDFGSVTVLFNWLGGLQIESQTAGREGEWDYVKPIPGHAIINLGDAMVKFTNGVLKSAKHRVIPAPGEQANHERISIVYFVRPSDVSLMEPIAKFKVGDYVKVGGKASAEGDRSRIYTAAEWIAKRNVQMAS